jgi:hypothetical protein
MNPLEQGTAAGPHGASPTPKHLLAGVIERFRLNLQAAGTTADSQRMQLEHLQVLQQRASAQVERLASNLESLYGGRQDVPAVLEKLLEVFIANGLERPEELRQLDAAREHDPNWFSSNKALGAALYVDRHCGTLHNLEKEISNFELLNVSMLHLMPTIYKTPEKDNDGGYAISDFRTVNPAIGTMDELRELAGGFGGPGPGCAGPAKSASDGLPLAGEPRRSPRGPGPAPRGPVARQRGTLRIRRFARHRGGRLVRAACLARARAGRAVAAALGPAAHWMPAPRAMAFSHITVM